MTYYLGRVGALVALPDPEIGLEMPTERVGSVHQLLGGGRVTDTIARLRSWNLQWTAIDLTTYGSLEAFTYSTGPYVLSDPEQRNLLLPNVSSGGDALNSVIGVTTGPNVTVSASTTTVRSDGVSSFLAAEPTSVIANQDVLYGTAVTAIVAGLTYTFSAWLNPNASSPGHYTWMEWLDTSQTLISGATGSTIATNTSGFSTVTATAPANAAYVRVRVRTAAANTAGATVFMNTDSWQLEQAGARSAWVIGPGVPLVTVQSLTRTTPRSGLVNAQMTLTQVG